MVERISINSIKNSIEESKPELVEFKSGVRNVIHPKFNELDTIDCKFYYNKQKRFFIVDYSPAINSGTKIYTRSVMSNNIDYIIECVKSLQGVPLI